MDDKTRHTTRQRRLLLDLIREANGHLDASELFRRAREQDACISLATVYRNLGLFKHLGLVAERHLGEEHHHYEASGSSDHYHLVCLGCGQVFEFQWPLIKRLVSRVSGDTGFRITDGQIEFEGYCAACQRAGVGRANAVAGDDATTKGSQ